MWDFIPIDAMRPVVGPLANGTRVARVGTVSFDRSGFARVNWSDGRSSDEWTADLLVIVDGEVA